MRVLVLAPELPSRSQTFVINEVRVLRDLGADVAVWAVRRGQGNDLERNLQLMAAPLRVRRLRLHDLLRTVRADMSVVQGRERSRLALAAVRSLLLAARLPAGPWHLHAHFLGRAADMARYLQAVAPSLVTSVSIVAHAGDAARPAAPSLLAGRVGAADAIVVASEFVRSALIDRGVDPSKLHLVHCGVRVPEAWPRRARTGPLKILTTARLHPQKGWHEVLSAAGLLEQRGFAFTWDAIGSGTQEAELTAAHQALRLTRLRWLGAQSHEASVQAVKDADVFVLPSRLSADGVDGIPVAVMEAMAHGAAVITTDVGGLGEIADANTALVVPPERPERVFEAVLELAGDGQRRDALALAAYRRVKEDFNLPVEVGRLLALLESLSGGRTAL